MNLRWLAGKPDWPLVAGIVLGLLGTAETVLRIEGLRTSGSDVAQPIATLLGLCATGPLAFATRHVVAAAATITAATLLTALFYRWEPTVTGVIATVIVWVLIASRRARRLRVQALDRDRAAAQDTLLELTVRGERARIARELHDVVAHHISMISVQAETARLTTPGMPVQGAKRLLAIGDTARTALAEMRRLLGVLREDAGPDPSRQPQPGLPQLLELVDETRASSGVSARLIVRGRVTALDPGIELTAYRIVQESLTNACRHAPGAAIDVELHYTTDALYLRVRDIGPGPSSNTGGHGLLGMRERVATVGGVLRTGPAPGNGFLVEATLPTANTGASQ